MTQSPKRPNSSPSSEQQNKNHPSSYSQNHHRPPDAEQQRSEDIVTAIVREIDGLKTGLKEYKICKLVEDTEKLGKKLADNGLKTNQIRKFLDAVNRFKVQQREKKIQQSEKKDRQSENFEFSAESKDELHVLRYQLAYAAARQQRNREPGPVEPLKKVLESAIKQVTDLEDFNRFVQLIESIVAYHKAAGGKDQ